MNCGAPIADRHLLTSTGPYAPDVDPIFSGGTAYPKTMRIDCDLEPEFGNGLNPMPRDWNPHETLWIPRKIGAILREKGCR